MIRKNFILLLLLNLAGVLFAQLTISPTASPSIPEGSNINLGDYFSVSGGTPTGWTLDGKSITFTNVSLSYKDNGKLLQCKDASGSSNLVPIKVIGKPTVTSLTGMPTELLKEGDQVTLTVTFKANGSTGHTYQWYIGNQAIANATTATLNYTFAKADHGKTIKIAIKATEFTDATEASAGVTFDGTMITDKNPALPAGAKLDNTAFPVTVGQTFTDPVVDYEATNHGGTNYFVTQNTQYTNNDTHTVTFNGKEYSCTIRLLTATPYAPEKVTSSITSAARIPANILADNNTLFFDSGIYVPIESTGESVFIKTGLKVIGLGDRTSQSEATVIGPNYGYWATTNAYNYGHIKYKFSHNVVMENIVFDGAGMRFYGNGSKGGSNQKNNYYFITLNNVKNIVFKDITFRNIGTTTYSYSILNMTEGEANIDNDERDPNNKRYYINITFESGNLSGSYEPININTTDGHYFKNIYFKNALTTNVHQIAITGKNAHGNGNPGCRNIIFAGDLELYDKKKIRLWKYTSTGISFPEKYKYLELKTTPTTSDYTYDITIAREIDTPSASYPYLDASDGSYIVFNSLNDPFKPLSNLFSGTVKNQCTLPTPTLVKLVSKDGKVGGFTVHDYSKVQTNIVAVNAYTDPLTQVNESNLFKYNGSKISFNTTNPEYIRLHNIDFSEDYSIYDAVKDDGNNVTNSNYGSFYNCKFKAPQEGDPLVVEGDLDKLQWSVSKTTNEIYEYKDVENNSTTSVMEGTPVYVQIRPVYLDRVDYDRWAIEYTATPVDYHYPMEDAIAKTIRYDFNKGEAHVLPGTYYYNVSKLILYKGNREVATYNYRDATCTHTVIIQAKPIAKIPALQWSVSTATHEQSNFRDVDDQTTTSVNYGTPVFVQIRPIGHEDITFERWDVEYSVTPAEHYYGMNPIVKTERHNFNNREAHTEIGTYIYTVTKLTLYDLYGNKIVETYDYNDSPYKHTIIIKDDEGPGPDPHGALQWSVSTASNQLQDFRDVDNLTTTSVVKGTPVYVQIRPVGFNNITYDRWEIEYTATPADYHYPLEEAVPRTERYTFNRGEAHTLVGTYVYTVTKLTLYNGESVALTAYYTEPPYVHTIIIRDGGMIELGDIASHCGSESEFRIPFRLLDPDNILEYSVRFSDEALKAGFTDSDYKDVTPDYLTVPVYRIIGKGVYTGNVYVRKKSDPGLVELHPFEIEMLETTMITKQPQSVYVCDGDAFTLSVEARGLNLTYQWFFNKEAIEGATSATYQAALTPDKEGSYYVDVYGDCGMESSVTVTVRKNGLRVLVKWNEFLYITNPGNEFVRFQWYHDGQKIEKNGTSIYYSVPEGLLGSYFIQAYRADDSYVVSCPITFDTLTQFPVTTVYPTMVQKNSPITIKLGMPGEALEAAGIEIYNLNGQLVEKQSTATVETTIPANMASGSYIVKVTTDSGRTTTHKIIVK
ncbi:T9SS type A sorting domain-containing protein [Parabacteroides sp. W1-Q-101]|nr:T9SS type A sorting domain-containing protein [Parabacteroides sp. W1-Q-101]MCM0719533.1 T9SS type A sorting domain-containing protein [Parabacteroides sp. W1-Q-101]